MKIETIELKTKLGAKCLNSLVYLMTLKVSQSLRSFITVIQGNE